jgi:hypothetical protein
VRRMRGARRSSARYSGRWPPLWTSSLPPANSPRRAPSPLIYVAGSSSLSPPQTMLPTTEQTTCPFECAATQPSRLNPSPGRASPRPRKAWALTSEPRRPRLHRAGALPPLIGVGLPSPPAKGRTAGS